MKNKYIRYIACCLAAVLTSCSDYYKNDYYDNSPTSGKLNVYCSEGLLPHLKNQAYTFGALYPSAFVSIHAGTEQQAIQALLNDSCKAIVVNRLLGEQEVKLFAQKSLSPAWSPLAKTGIAVITGRNSPLRMLSVEQVKQLLSQELVLKDSLSHEYRPNAIVDNANSDVSHYLRDSVLKAAAFGPKVYATGSTLELIRKVAGSPGQIGFIDFAWLSDSDDSLYKAVMDKLKFVAIGQSDTIFFSPNQSSFKTGDYPFTRTVYLLRRSDDFSLAKGFESYMAGPKGQITFLKQGLLPVRQAARMIDIKTGP
ncbi:MAG: PstS family phosphate ABC transporter substrate-binding protein [Bacteroidia bacterium]